MAISGNIRYSQVKSGDRSGTGAKVATVTGTLTAAKQLNFDANGNVVASAFGVGGGGGGIGSSSHVLLAEKTASASSSLDFAGYITSLYDDYQIVMSNIITSVDDVEVLLRVSTNGGSSYISAAEYDYSMNFMNNASALNSKHGGGQTGIFLAHGYTTSAKMHIHGVFYVFSPLSAVGYKAWRGATAFASFAVDGGGGDFVGWWRGAETAIDAFQIYPASGTLTSGKARLYGLVK
jgi:hypothetical protein